MKNNAETAIMSVRGYTLTRSSETKKADAAQSNSKPKNAADAFHTAIGSLIITSLTDARKMLVGEKEKTFRLLASVFRESKQNRWN